MGFIHRMLLIVVAALASSSCSAQGLGTPLRIIDKTGPLAIPAGFSMPVVGNGGFYLRLSSPAGNDDAVHWYASTGQKETLLQFSQIARTPARKDSNFDIADMTPLPEGGLAMLGFWSKPGEPQLDNSIELFEQNGIYKGSVPIPAGSHPVHLGALKSSFLVLAGKEQADGFGAEMLLLLDLGGRILKTRTVESVPASSEPPPTSNPEKSSTETGTSESNSKEWMLWETISSARIVSGEDNMLYLLHRSPGGKSFSVRPNGAMEEFKLEAPPLLSNEKALVVDGYEKSSKLIVEFMVQKQDAPTTGKMKSERIVLGVYSAGNPSKALEFFYTDDPTLSPFLAGGDASRFAFLSFAPDLLGVRHRTIVTVGP